MFEAIIIVCNIMFQNCVQLNDTFGPYPTKQDCFDRLVVMERGVLEAFPETPLRYQKHCIQITDGKELII